MGFQESLARWGAARLAETSTYDPADIDTATIDVAFEYERPWQYSEYTGGGGVASVKVTGTAKDGHWLSRTLASSDGGQDLTWSLSDLAAQIAQHDEPGT